MVAGHGQNELGSSLLQQELGYQELDTRATRGSSHLDQSECSTACSMPLHLLTFSHPYSPDFFPADGGEGLLVRPAPHLQEDLLRRQVQRA